MQYCNKCLTTNLRPNAQFENGVCIACLYSENTIAKPQTLKLRSLRSRLADAKRKRRKKSAFDCIVGVSGGKDSTRQAHWVRDRLGMKPLLVCAAYPPRQMTHIGADNLSNLISMGFDIFVLTPAPQTAAELSLVSFKQFGNVCKSTELSLFSTVPRIAVEFDIPLIFWGENPALQVGDSAVLGEDEFDGNNLRKLNTLTQGGTEWIADALNQDTKIAHYLYPDEISFNKKKINIFYLGAAWDDWSMEQNSMYAALQGLTLRPNDERLTGDLSNSSMLDEEFTNINMMLKYYKFGFGRATDLVNEAIRAQKITRKEGISLVEEFDGVCADIIIERYCQYVGISKRNFWDITNTWVNTHIFEISGNGRPIPKFKVGLDYEN